MNLEQKTQIPASEIANSLRLTVTITGVRRFRFRIWIGAQLIQLAALAIGCGIEIKIRRTPRRAKRRRRG